MVSGFKRKTQKEKAKCKSVFAHEGKEHRKESDAEPMKNPCKACAEIFCMGVCADRVQHKQEYQEMTDRIRQQIINYNRRVHGQEDIKAVQTIKEGTGDDRKETG